MTLTRRNLLISAVCAIGAPAFSQENFKRRVFVASYQGDSNSGIYAIDFNEQTGALETPVQVAKMPYAGNLYENQTRDTIYCGSGDDAMLGGTNYVAAFDISSGGFKELNRLPTGGFRPSHGAVNSKGEYLVLPNYRSDNIAVFSLNEDGSLKELVSLVGKQNGSRAWQQGSWNRAHITIFSESENYVLAAEIERRRVVVYRFDPQNGSLQYHSEERIPNGGPRHLFFHPSYKYVYSSNESGSSASAFRWDEGTGTLSFIQTIRSTPMSYNGDNSPSHIEVDPSGRYVYLANRGHNSIAMFTIDQSNGTLVPMGQFPLGARSWCFNTDPSGKWILVGNNSNDLVVVLKIDQQTGFLLPTRHRVSVPSPACIKIV